MASLALTDPAAFVRSQLVRRVRAVFNDPARGEAPVVPSADALFAPDTPIRMVHADVISMMVGGVAALLLQMLHPHALRGVLDHSNFRADMHGRLRRTARFIAMTTYGERTLAEQAIARVNAIHTQVSGTLPDGTRYSATDPHVLAWVHVTGAVSFLDAYLRYVRPDMPLTEQDEYFRQFALVARMLGADPVPETRAEAATIMQAMRPELAGGPDVHEIARVVMENRAEGMLVPVQSVITSAAVDMLPPYARTMLELNPPALAGIPAKVAARSLGETMRWAFRRT